MSNRNKNIISVVIMAIIIFLISGCFLDTQDSRAFAVVFTLWVASELVIMWFLIANRDRFF